MPYEEFSTYLFRLSRIFGHQPNNVILKARRNKNFFQRILEENNLCTQKISKDHTVWISNPSRYNKRKYYEPMLLPYNAYSARFKYCESCAEDDMQSYGHSYYRSYNQPACVFICQTHKNLLLTSSGVTFTIPNPVKEYTELPCNSLLHMITEKFYNISHHQSFREKRPTLERRLVELTSDKYAVENIVKRKFDKVSLGVILDVFHFNFSHNEERLMTCLFDNNASDAELFLLASIIIDPNEFNEILSVK
jgi:hypothetical protein